MKKTLLSLGVIAAGLLASQSSFAQANYPYTFSAATGAAYTPLSASATEIIGANGWDDSLVAVTIPFDFNFWGTPKHDLYVDLSGGIDYEESDISRILGFYTDYMDRGNSIVSLETTGATPSRIAKIEFKNVGFYEDSTSAKVDSANFQIWLYESGKIEYRAGTSYTNDVSFSDDNNPLYSGLIYTTNGYTDQTAIDTFHFVGYQNNAPKDSVMYFNIDSGPSSAADFSFMNYGRFPANGTVFTFTPPTAPTAIHDVKQALNFSLYPNPAKESMVLNLPEMPAKNATFRIMDVSGKVVSTQNITTKTTTINVSQLAAGFYYGSFNDDTHSGKTKFVKQ